MPMDILKNEKGEIIQDLTVNGNANIGTYKHNTHHL